MGVRENYNELIQYIENQIGLEHRPIAREIAVAVCKKSGMGYRDLSTVFSYLTGAALQDYIRERKLMAAYEVLITGDTPDISKAVEVSGYDNQSSFGKRVREVFGMTPKEAGEQKNSNLILPPKTWENISEEVKDDMEAAVLTEDVSATRFGITSEQYKRMVEAADLEALYEFNREQSEAAFELANDYPEYSMETAFKYVSGICDEKFGSDDEKIDYKLLKEYINEECSDEVLWLISAFPIYPKHAKKILAATEAAHCDLGNVEEELLKSYLDADWNVDNFVWLINMFAFYEGKDLEMYLRCLNDGYEIHEAAAISRECDYENEVMPTDAEYERMLEEDEYLTAIEGDETDYANMERIDVEYDMDNYEYEIADRDCQ